MRMVVVMILRVWAMYNRSKLVLYPLLVLFVLEIISLIVVSGYNSILKNLAGMQMLMNVWYTTDQLSFTCPLADHRIAANIQVDGISICITDPDASPIWSQISICLQMVHGAAVCTLAIIQCVRQSSQMYRATTRWQLNRYMGLFAQQGILYFISYVYILFLSPCH